MSLPERKKALFLNFYFMIYKHKFFILDSDIRKVFDENSKELKITGNSFRILVFLCEHGPATITAISDALDRAKDYDEEHIRQYRYKINTIIGKNIVKYENKIYFIDGGTEKIKNKDSLILNKNSRNTDLLQSDSVKLIADSDTTMDQEKYCTKCGKKIQKKNKFCVFCGVLLENKKYKSSVIYKNKKIYYLSFLILFTFILAFIILNNKTQPNNINLTSPMDVKLKNSVESNRIKNNNIVPNNSREITIEEINKFVPVNYSTIKSEYTNNIVLKKINDIYILPIGYNGDMFAEGMAKIIILKYNNNLDKYEKINEYVGPGDYISYFDISYDVDNDGLNEIFVVFKLSGVSGNDYTLEIINFRNNKFEKLLSADVLNENYYRYDNSKNMIIAADYIWGQNESHYGCHYFNIETYSHDNKFILKNKSQTKFKYDMGDGIDIDYIKCLPFKENFNDFLINESIIY